MIFYVNDNEILDFENTKSENSKSKYVSNESNIDLVYIESHSTIRFTKSIDSQSGKRFNELISLISEGNIFVNLELNQSGIIASNRKQGRKIKNIIKKDYHIFKGHSTSNKVQLEFKE